jgi:hypothetical protein
MAMTVRVAQASGNNFPAHSLFVTSALKQPDISRGGGMARVTELPQFRPVWIWDITDRVGWGLANRRADVQLVQLSINKLIPKLGLVDFSKPQAMGPMGRTHAPLQPLKVDGLVGNKTANAIASYIRRKGNTADQAIDPVYPLLGRLGGDPIGRVSWHCRPFISGRCSSSTRTIFRPMAVSSTKANFRSRCRGKWLSPERDALAFARAALHLISFAAVV